MTFSDRLLSGDSAVDRIFSVRFSFAVWTLTDRLRAEDFTF